MSSLRWILTALTAFLVVATAACSTHRLVASTLRAAADRHFFEGDLAAALETYESARRWDPLAAGAATDPADAAVYALAERAAGHGVLSAVIPDLGVTALALFSRAVDQSLPGSWSWSGIAQIYDQMRTYRLRTQGFELSSLSADPLDNLFPEDRLAEAALRQALLHDPRNYFYLDSLGELYWSRGLHARALAPFRQAVRVHPILGEHYYIVERVRHSAQLGEAVGRGLAEALDAALPDDRWVVHGEQARLAVLREQPVLALDHYRRAIANASAAPVLQRAVLHVDAARVLRETERFSEAEEQLQHAIALQPERALFYADLGQTQARRGHHAEAMRSLGAARALEPDSPRIVRALALAARSAGEFERAERAYQELLRLEPDRDEPYILLIDMFRSAGQEIQAIPYAEALAQRHPEEPLYRRQVEQLYLSERGR